MEKIFKWKDLYRVNSLVYSLETLLIRNGVILITNKIIFTDKIIRFRKFYYQHGLEATKEELEQLLKNKESAIEIVDLYHVNFDI